ncbi:MAG: hypothetical protein ACI4BI_02520 [Anaerotardibacter sp.]
MIKITKLAKTTPTPNKGSRICSFFSCEIFISDILVHRKKKRTSLDRKSIKGSSKELNVHTNVAKCAHQYPNNPREGARWPQMQAQALGTH